MICKGTPLGYLYTQQDYKDFKLRLEWRWPPGKEPGKGGVLLRMQNLAITHASAGINASGRGYGCSEGPGAGSDDYYGSGGGYGGKGGDSSKDAGASTNGNQYAPLGPGSGGGQRTTRPGGGGSGGV